MKENNTLINNIKLNIKECFGNAKESKNANRNIRKIRKIKDINKNRKFKKNYIKYNISEDYTKYIDRINTIDRNLYRENNGKGFYYCFINNDTNDMDKIDSDVEFDIEIKMDSAGKEN